MSSARFLDFKNVKFVRNLGVYVPPTFKRKIVQHGALAAFKDMMENSYLYKDISFDALNIKVKLIDFISIVYYLLDNVRRSNSVIQMMLHIMVALERLMKKNFSDLINVVGEYLIKMFIEIFGEEIIAKSQSEFIVKNVQHAQDFIKNVRDNIFSITEKIESQFAQKLAIFMGGVLTLPMALHYKVGENWFGYTQNNIRSMIRKRDDTHTFVFTTKVIDSFLYLIDRMLDCIKCKDLNRLTFDDDFILNYKEHYNWHIHHSNCLELVTNYDYVDVVTNEKSVHKYTYESYLRNIEALLQMNEDISRTNCDPKIKGQIKVEKSVLDKARLNVLLKLEVNGGREAPFAIAIVGPPGIGKSQIVYKYLKIKNDIDKGLGRNPVGFKEDLCYHYNGRDKYMSGLTASHTAFIMDDLGQFKDDITVAQQGGPVAFVIDVINDNKLVTEQAELELKGKVPFRCRDVVITSNFEDCGFNTVFDQKGGAWRRVLFMDCRVKKEFQMPGETRLAGDKDNPDNFDMHEFQFRKYLNFDGNNTRVVWDGTQWTENISSGKWMNIYEKAEFLRDEILIPRYEQQDRAKNAGNKFLNSGSCSECKLTSLLCRCAKAQSDESDEFEHTGEPRSSSSEDSIFLSPESWSDYAWRWVSLFSMISQYVLLHVFVGIETGPTRAARAQDGVISFNASHTEHDGVNSRLSRWRRYLCSYFHDHIYELTSRDFLTGVIKDQRIMRRTEFGVISIIGLLTTFIAMNTVLSRFNQEGEEEEEEKPEAVAQSNEDGDDEDDYWTVKYEDMTRMTGQSSNITVSQMKNLMQRNSMMLTFQFQGTHFDVNCLGLYGNVAVMPRHAYEQLCKHDFACTVTLLRHNKKLRSGASRYNVILDKTNFTVYSHCKDYVTVQSPTFGTFRDVTKFFLNKPFLGKAEGYVCGRDLDGNYVEFHVKAFQTSEVHYIHQTLAKRYRYIGYCAYSHRPTFTGLCGAAYIVKTCNGVFIAGIHVAMRNRGMDYEVLCCPLRTQEMDHKYHTLVPNSFNGLDLNETYKTEQDLAIAQTTHEKCPLRSLDNKTSLMFYGEIGLHRPKLKTAVTNTLIYEPVLKYFDMLEVEYFSPKPVNSRKCITMTVNKMCRKSSFVPSDVVNMKEALLKHFIRGIKEQDIKVDAHLAPLSAAINGADGEPYWNRLPVKTSGGFAHKGAKLKYFEEGASTPQHNLNYHLVDDIMHEINNALERIEQGERITSVWDITFKDEPITAEKIKKNKCRLFNSASLFFSILERQAFMWTFPLFCGKHRHLFCCAIGANATGRDWTVLRNHVTKFGSHRIIAGDYSSFDKGMEASLVAAAFDILIGMAKHFGFSHEDIKFMTAVATEVIYPITNVSGSIVEFYGTNPSGHSLTTIINSIVNCLYIMLACNDIASQDELAIDFDFFFERCISLLTYGDDNIASSNVDAFNHTRISAALAKYRVIYTMADKESESRPFIDLCEASFLKRTFVVREDKYVRAPLEEKSIIKMLTVCTRSRTISMEDQCAQIIDSACREYFQYGRKTFEKRRKFLTTLLTDYNLWGYLNYTELPTYEEIRSMCYGDIAYAQSECIYDASHLPEDVIPYGEAFIAFGTLAVTMFCSYGLTEFFMNVRYYAARMRQYGVRLYLLFHFSFTFLWNYFMTGNAFGIPPENIAPNECFDSNGQFIRRTGIALAQSEMIPDELVRAQSAPDLHDGSDTDSSMSEFDISDDAFMHYVRWDEQYGPLVDEYDTPEEQEDGAQIYDSCVLFQNCFCIARYGELFRELSCTRCHCTYGRNCVSSECNKENITITNV